MTTSDYTVVMAVVSLRFKNDSTHERLKASARRADMSLSARAEQLIEEGLRMEAHPLIHFRQGWNWRRPAVMWGPAVIEVVISAVGGEGTPDERRAWAAEHLAITEAQVDAALAYYAEFQNEVDEDIRVRGEFARVEEAKWRRQRELLAQ